MVLFLVLLILFIVLHPLGAMMFVLFFVDMIEGRNSKDYPKKKFVQTIKKEVPLVYFFKFDKMKEMQKMTKNVEIEKENRFGGTFWKT